MSELLSNDDKEDFHVLFESILEDEVEKQILKDLIDGLEPEQIYDKIVSSLRGAGND